MGQTTPIDAMWDMARANIHTDGEKPHDSDEVKREIRRIRSKINQVGIGDRAVYDETRQPSTR